MTAASTQKQTLGFQTEAKQLLHLMIHSLYSKQEIFLRELISNASDASDKLRFEALSNPDLLAEDPNLEIRIGVDKEARTITITDNGIGMSREEAVSHLGTIARSGTAQFVSQLSGDQRKKYAARVKDLAEEARVSMRNSRRDENKRADALFKDSKMTEDEHKKCLEDIQKCLKEYEDKVTGALDKKTAEVMEN